MREGRQCCPSQSVHDEPEPEPDRNHNEQLASLAAYAEKYCQLSSYFFLVRAHHHGNQPSPDSESHFDMFAGRLQVRWRIEVAATSLSLSHSAHHYEYRGQLVSWAPGVHALAALARMILSGSTCREEATKPGRSCPPSSFARQHEGSWWASERSSVVFRAFWRPSTTIMAHRGVHGDGRGSQPMKVVKEVGRSGLVYSLSSSSSHRHHLCRFVSPKRSSVTGSEASSGQLSFAARGFDRSAVSNR